MLYNEFQQLLIQLKNNQFNNFSSFIKASDSLLRKLNNDTKKYILVTLPFYNDNAILCIPFINRLRDFYKNYEILVICGENYTAFFNQPVISCKIDNTNIFTMINSSIEFAHKYLWDKNIEIAYTPSFDSTLDNLFINYFSGAKKKLGFSRISWYKYFTDNELKEFYKIDKQDNMEQYLLDEINYSLECTNDIDKSFLCDANLAFSKKTNSINKNKIVLGIAGNYIETLKEINSNENNKYSLKSYAIALLTLLQDNKDLEIYIIGSEYEKRYIYMLLTDDIYTINDNYKNLYMPLEKLELAKFNKDKVHIENFTLDEQITLIKENLYIGNDNYLSNLAVILNSPAIVLLSESEEYDEDEYKNYLSIYLRKYSNSENIKIIKPEYSAGICVESKSYGYCSVDYPHCINEINYNQIVDLYNII